MNCVFSFKNVASVHTVDLSLENHVLCSNSIGNVCYAFKTESIDSEFPIKEVEVTRVNLLYLHDRSSYEPLSIGFDMWRDEVEGREFSATSNGTNNRGLIVGSPDGNTYFNFIDIVYSFNFVTMGQLVDEIEIDYNDGTFIATSSRYSTKSSSNGVGNIALVFGGIAINSDVSGSGGSYGPSDSYMYYDESIQRINMQNQTDAEIFTNLLVSGCCSAVASTGPGNKFFCNITHNDHEESNGGYDIIHYVNLLSSTDAVKRINAYVPDPPGDDTLFIPGTSISRFGCSNA